MTEKSQLESKVLIQPEKSINIVVSGGIAVRKSTTCDKIAKKFDSKDIKVYPEKYDKTILDRAYYAKGNWSLCETVIFAGVCLIGALTIADLRNMMCFLKQWILILLVLYLWSRKRVNKVTRRFFRSQVDFITQRVGRVQEIEKDGAKIRLMDRSAIDDPVFEMAKFKQGLIKKSDHGVYRKFIEIVFPLLPKIDHILYMSVKSIGYCMANVATRIKTRREQNISTENEESLTRNDLKTINDEYELWKVDQKNLKEFKEDEKGVYKEIIKIAKEHGVEPKSKSKLQ